jgi:hypothetical protein
MLALRARGYPKEDRIKRSKLPKKIEKNFILGLYNIKASGHNNGNVSIEVRDEKVFSY